MEFLRFFAAATTIIAAITVAANWSPKTTVVGFGIFIVASLAWMADGWAEDNFWLLSQNAVLFFVNVAGIYRWMPAASRDTDSGLQGTNDPAPR